MSARKRLAILTLSLAAFAFAAPSLAQQSGNGRSGVAHTHRPDLPTLPPTANAPPHPRGLGGLLPPGHGGPNPSENRAPLRPGLIRVCSAGGALTTGPNGQVGRDRAFAHACPQG